MASLLELLDSLLHKPNRQMAWGRIAPNHVVPARQVVQPFVPNDDYFVVRLGSMFLKDSRQLWLKLSPLAHAVVSSKGLREPKTETAVIGPAQFGDLATAPAERSVILNQRLAGPSVWRGGDLAVAAGLFAVPKDQAAAVLLDTLGQLSSIALPGLAQALMIAGVVKTGVEGLIGLNGTKPVLAVKDAFSEPGGSSTSGAAAPCVLAAIAAPAADVDFEKLWVKDGRLWQGAAADALTVYEQHDHMLVSVERGAPRQDWRGLPALTPHEAAFDAILRSSVSKDTAAQQMNDEYARFDADLVAEDELTNPDKERIRGEVVAELAARLQRKFAGPFGAPLERRSVAGIPRVPDPEHFSFLDVGAAGPERAKLLKAGATPF